MGNAVYPMSHHLIFFSSMEMSSHSLYLDARSPSHSVLKGTTLSWVANRLHSLPQTLIRYEFFWYRECLLNHT